MTLYHVSFGFQEKIKKFTPRVPDRTSYSEKVHQIPRVCLAESIQGCLSAVPSFDTDGVYDNTAGGKSVKLTIYKVDTDKCKGVRFVPWTELTNKVSDAYYTKEWWCLDELVLTGEHYILKDYHQNEVILIKEEYKKLFVSYLLENYRELQGLKVPKGLNIKDTNSIVEWNRFSAFNIINNVLSFINWNRLLGYEIEERAVIYEFATRYNLYIPHVNEISNIKLQKIK